jgi:hypothetical protein
MLFDRDEDGVLSFPELQVITIYLIFKGIVSHETEIVLKTCKIRSVLYP